jgi:NACalpha-BTF3-like transcription factor
MVLTKEKIKAMVIEFMEIDKIEECRRRFDRKTGRIIIDEPAAIICER